MMEWLMFQETSENDEVREPSFGSDRTDSAENGNQPRLGAKALTARAKSEPRGFERRPPATPGEQITILPDEVVPPSRRRVRGLPVFALAAALVLGGAGWYGYQWLTVGRFIISTDDAYVRAHNTTLADKLSGYLASIELEDNSVV